MKRDSPNTIERLCKAHRATHYFVDESGLIGVYGHRNTVLWYCLISDTAGDSVYSLVGSTDTPEGAEIRKLDE